MKSINSSIDSYYLKINKILMLAQGYTEIKEFSSIVKSCRLKPFELGDYKLTLRKHWIDEFGNSFKITRNKRLGIMLNDLSIDRGFAKSTDMYFGLPINKVIKMSKRAYLCYAYDEEPIIIASFFGIDNYFRTYINYDGDWEQVSPLFLGIRTLKLFFQKMDIRIFVNYKNKNKLPIPCESGEEWITSLPVNKILLKKLELQYGSAFSFLNGE